MLKFLTYDKKENSNVFVSILHSLGVKHTVSHSNKVYNEHPNKYNLLGLSQMLSGYGIENAGLRIDNKEKGLSELGAPFIAHAGGDFVTVNKLTPNTIDYLWQGKEISISIDEFKQSWSGVVLLVEPDENSIEPDYKENRKKELFSQIQQYVLALSIVAVIVLVHILNGLWNNWGSTLSLIINLTGVYMGYLLLQKQMHVQSSYADKICSLFKQSDCNNILESDASKLMGIIGWSEIGLGYFISNIIIALFLPEFTVYSAIINCCALPYTIWSIWYQGVKAKQWCPLCLIVQVLLWGLFIVNGLSGIIYFPVLSFLSIVLVACIYLIPVLIINLSLPKLSSGNKVEQITQEINSLKTTEEVFLALLKKQSYYQVDKSISKILFGNPDANTLVTILTNPHCEPCSRMHTRVEKLLEHTGGKICIQYIFSSFSEELESSSDFLIRSYLANEKKQSMSIFNDWFQFGKQNRNDYFEKQAYTPIGSCKELLQHKKWKESTKLSATPTLLVNGYKLPDNYKIEDLKFITEFDVNFK